MFTRRGLRDMRKLWPATPALLAAYMMTGCMHLYIQNTKVIPPAPDHPYYEITQPIVNTRLAAYPQIHFNPGDRVTVLEAGGCVNTGGSGKTWKDYVSPKGAEAARLYHGLIWIPGAAQDGKFVPEGSAPMRIEGAVGKSYTIDATSRTPDQLQLYLGYEDDHYKDNGYYKDKKGATGDQCRPVTDGGGKSHITPAYVKIRVEPAGATGPAAQFKPFDIVARELDPNGLLRNPIWWQQSDKTLVHTDPPFLEADPLNSRIVPDAAALCGSFPSLPAQRTHGFALCPNGCSSGTCQCADPCSSQAPSFDYPIDFSVNKWFSCFDIHRLDQIGKSLNGHANWAPVMYTGTISWAGEPGPDEDADIIMHRLVSATDKTFDWSGFSNRFKEEIEIEMAGYETWDSFGTQWFSKVWNGLHKDQPLNVDAQVIGQRVWIERVGF
jgi:hypothetical protein